MHIVGYNMHEMTAVEGLPSLV